MSRPRRKKAGVREVIEGVEIEEGVPIPHRRARQGILQTITQAMLVGDSFAWPRRAKMKQYTHDGREGFTSRRMPDGSYRIWRVK